METELNESTQPKAPRKRAKRRTRAPVTAPKQDAIYDGITPVSCPSACKPDRCVISESGICAHPYKGGLQARMQTPEATRRLNEAKRVLGKRKLDVAAE